MRRPDDVRPGRSGLSRTASVSLARALSKFGVCSRKQAEGVIAEGRVRVNGRPEANASRFIDPVGDRVTLDGLRVGDLMETVALALHKPAGYITSRTDPAGRPTIYHLLDETIPWVFPVGRLDRDTSGLLILTNDHRLGHRLTDPGAHLPKTYHALVRGVPPVEALAVLREGVPIGDSLPTRPATVTDLGHRRDGNSWLEIVLTEGRNRQVRRMCAAVGHDVLELVRVQIGDLPLGDLASGSWRRLSRADIERLASQKRR